MNPHCAGIQTLIASDFDLDSLVPGDTMAQEQRLSVYVGGLEHETNTYATAVTGLTTRRDFHEVVGDALVARHAQARTPLGGFIAAARELNVKIVPGVFFHAEPSGMYATVLSRHASTYLYMRLMQAK